MTKRGSEDKVREAIEGMDLDVWLYKPPDDARNWKPADYILWYQDLDGEELMKIAQTAMVEAKDTPAVSIVNLSSLLRPSQHAAGVKAHFMGIPYLVVIWWRRRSMWSISDYGRLMEKGREKSRCTYTELTSTLGVEAAPHLLTSVLRAVLVDDLI